MKRPPPAELEGPARSRASRVLTDVHFWIPVIVLIAGLFVLQWIR